MSHPGVDEPGNSPLADRASNMAVEEIIRKDEDFRKSIMPVERDSQIAVLIPRELSQACAGEFRGESPHLDRNDDPE